MAEDKRILIVDDEEDSVTLIALMFSEVEGVTSLSALGGEEGLRKARETVPDLIILDMQMPDKNGSQVFDELMRDDRTKDIPVVMLTGIAEKIGIRLSGKEMREYLGKAPAAYLEKSAEPEKLLKTVTDLLNLP